MFLVAGLAVAGVAGILAAIYFSVRSGKRGGKRLRPAGPGRIGADRTGASRTGASRTGASRTGASRTGASRSGAVRRPGGRAALVRTGGQTEFALRASGPTRSAPGPGRPAAGQRPARAQAGALTESWPAAPSDLDDPQSGDAWPDDAWPGDSTATDPGLRAARPGADLDAPGPAKPGPGASRDARSRRRVGFRKGADIDEELWPAETFGGVSDEQFWDDLASDKPLTTTARTAQQDAGPRSRLLDTGSDTDPQGTQALGGDRSGPGQARSDRSRADRSRADQGRTDQGRTDQGRTDQGRAAGEGRRSAGYGAYPGPRTGTDPAAERTVVQPAYAATQPVKSMIPPSAPAAPKPFPGAPQPVKSTAPPPGPTQPVRAAASAGPSSTGPSGTGSAGTGPAGTGPSGTAGQPRGASAPPAETGHRRRPSGPDEDPLTSASFSLRQRGPVDGRSSLRSRDQQDAPRDRDAAGGPGRGPAAGPYGHTTPYSPAPAGTSYDDASSVTQMMSTPPYGEKYGSGSQADRRNGTRSHARPVGADTGERPRPTRPAYPQDVRQASGSYPAGAYPGNGHQGHGHQPGGYPGNSYPGNSYPGSGHQGSGYPDSGHQGGSNPGNGSRGHGHRAPHDSRDDYRRLTHQRLPSRLGSCPRETWSGRPPAACTRRWRDGR